MRTEEERVATVRKNWRCIKFMIAPTEAMQVTAVKQSRSAIQHIPQPTEAAQALHSALWEL